MKTKIRDLVPGDLVFTSLRTWSVFISSTIHPIPEWGVYQGLWLVIWRMNDGSYSFDCLSPDTQLDHTVNSNNRQDNLKWGLGLYEATKPEGS